MTFSEKLTALLSHTAAKSAELADALGVGRPYISRLKNGNRDLSSNRKLQQAMAEYFAKRCTDEYRRKALRELTSDSRMDTYADEAVLTDVIRDWLTGAVRKTPDPASHFLKSISMFSMDSVQDGKRTEDCKVLDANGVAVYYKNSGKRMALRDMVNYISTISEPCSVLLMTDENYSWVAEDTGFIKWINGVLSQGGKSDISFERIQPPFFNTEYTFSAIERWLPCYMTGNMRQYYYPMARDHMHRCTIFAVPGHIAMFSHSQYGAAEAEFTILTRDPGIVKGCVKDFYSLRALCRPALTTFTAASKELASEGKKISAIQEDGICKTDRLSINTLPPEIVNKYIQSQDPFTRELFASYGRRIHARSVVLQEHQITDVMCLPSLENVMAGKEPIPGTHAIPNGLLYYSPRQYKAHLEQILRNMLTYPNYRAVFVDNPLINDLVMLTKGDLRVLLIKNAQPFTVFDVTEHSMAAALSDYLQRIAEREITPGYRQAVIERIEREIQQLSNV